MLSQIIPILLEMSMGSFVNKNWTGGRSEARRGLKAHFIGLEYRYARPGNRVRPRPVMVPPDQLRLQDGVVRGRVRIGHDNDAQVLAGRAAQRRVHAEVSGITRQ